MLPLAALGSRLVLGGVRLPLDLVFGIDKVQRVIRSLPGRMQERVDSKWDVVVRRTLGTRGGCLLGTVIVFGGRTILRLVIRRRCPAARSGLAAEHLHALADHLQLRALLAVGFPGIKLQSSL